jgi:hypothetical protein
VLFQGASSIKTTRREFRNELFFTSSDEIKLLHLLKLQNFTGQNAKNYNGINKNSFGGGCHWCTEAVSFKLLIGVHKVEQGFISSTAEKTTLFLKLHCTF